MYTTTVGAVITVATTADGTTRSGDLIMVAGMEAPDGTDPDGELAGVGDTTHGTAPTDLIMVADGTDQHIILIITDTAMHIQTQEEGTTEELQPLFPEAAKQQGVAVQVPGLPEGIQEMQTQPEAAEAL